MGSFPFDVQKQFGFTHCGIQYTTDASGGIQYEAVFGFKQRSIQMFGALNTDFLTDRE